MFPHVAEKCLGNSLLHRCRRFRFEYGRSSPGDGSVGSDSGSRIIYAFQKMPQFRQVFVLRKIKMELIVKTLKVGIPTGLQYSLIYVSSIVLQRIVNGIGTSVIGAFAATTQIE